MAWGTSCRSHSWWVPTHWHGAAAGRPAPAQAVGCSDRVRTAQPRPWQPGRVPLLQLYPHPGELWAEPHQIPWKWTVMHRREEHGRWFLPSSSSFTSFICLEFLSKEIYLFPNKASHSILCDRNKWIEKKTSCQRWGYLMTVKVLMFPHLFSDDIRGAAPVSRISLFYWKQSSFISSQRSQPLFVFFFF